MVPNWTQNGAQMEEFLKPNPPKMKTNSNEAWIKTSVKFLMLLNSRRISRAAAALNGLVGLPRSAKNLGSTDYQKGGTLSRVAVAPVWIRGQRRFTSS